jgi:tyrosyl-tRNA synthetase
MDQRKAHVIARDVANQMRISQIRDSKGGALKPCAIHHALLMGLVKPSVWPVPDDQVEEALTSMKMSKSKPNSAVFVHDSPDAIRDKIAKAFCPPSSAHFNPILDWTRRLVFDIAGGPFLVSKKHGGEVTFSKYQEVEDEYVSGALHPMDLKAAVSDWLIDYLKPARERFSQGPSAKALARLTSLVSG